MFWLDGCLVILIFVAGGGLWDLEMRRHQGVLNYKGKVKKFVKICIIWTERRKLERKGKERRKLSKVK